MTTSICGSDVTALGPGAILGESSLVAGSTTLQTVTAATAARLLVAGPADLGDVRELPVVTRATDRSPAPRTGGEPHSAVIGGDVLRRVA